MTTESFVATNHSILDDPIRGPMKILFQNDPDVWQEDLASEQPVEEEMESDDDDDDDDDGNREIRLSNCDLFDLPTFYRSYSKGKEVKEEVMAPPKSSLAASILKKVPSPVGSPTDNSSSKLRKMTSIRTFDSIAFEENQSNSKSKEIWKRNSGGLYLSEPEEQQQPQPFSIFSKNVDFLQELMKEATDNMERTAKVLREEPKGDVLRAIVQSKFDCLGRNMGTLSSILRSRKE